MGQQILSRHFVSILISLLHFLDDGSLLGPVDTRYELRAAVW